MEERASGRTPATRKMAELTVVILAVDDDHRQVLQLLVDGTNVAKTVHTFASFPVSATDATVRRINDLAPDVLLVDIPSANSAAALRTIELLHLETPKSAIFAIGDMSHPQVIVAAMRSGAREYIERPTTTTALLEAFVRLTSAQRKLNGEEQRGRVITVVNAKGGSGATTIAVNTALALQSSLGRVALVDIASLGHAALHLNLKPPFTIVDAVRNLHRMDVSLLESFMVQHSSGLQVLAGASHPFNGDLSGGDMARLFDLLVRTFRFVIVDASSRMDTASRIVCDLSDSILLVAHTDVASLWSAARVTELLRESGANERVRLVLNRFRKISGFSESDAEVAAGAKLLWKIPNNYPAVSAAIDRGTPIIAHNNEVARSLQELAGALTKTQEVKRKWSLFKTA
jgi:pilus assembly protein CpaE